MWKWLSGLVSRQNDFAEQEQGFVRGPGGGIIMPSSLYDSWIGKPQTIRVDKTSILGIPAFKRAVELVSDKIALCHCNVFRRLPSGREFAKDHRAWKPLRQQTNIYNSPFDFHRQIVFDSKWSGNGYGYIAPDFQLWNLDPDAVTPVVVHTPTTQDIYYLVQQGSQKIVLDASQVIHIRGLGHECGLVGKPLLKVAVEVLKLGLSSTRYASKFYEMGGVADVWIEYPDFISPEDATENLKMLRARHTGIEQAHCPLIVKGGGRLQKTVLSGKDSMMLEARQFTLLDAALLVGITPSAVGYRDGNSSYNSLESDREAALSDTYDPILTALESQYNLKLRTEIEKATDEYYIEFDRHDLQKGNRETEAKIEIMRFHAGLDAWEECREADNRPTDVLDNLTFMRPTTLVQGFDNPAPPPMPPPGPVPPQSDAAAST